MAITDELRGWMNDNYPAWKKLHTGVLNMLDRIDAEHEREISRAAQLLADAEKDRDFNYFNWQDCKQKVLQHNTTIGELSAEIEHLKDELAHRIELPKDADGEYINIGDVMESGDGDVFIVSSVDYGRHPSHPSHGYGEFWMLWSDDADFYELAYKCHHHALTVEDALHELIGKALMLSEIDGENELVAEYAKRLRLDGDAE